MPADDKWLEQYISNAATKKLCVKIGCTTCGAQEFRKGLLGEFARISGRTNPTYSDALEDIARALRTASRPVVASREVEQAIRLILFEIWNVLGSSLAEKTIQPILTGSWSGDILAGMQAHHREGQEARRAYLETQDPVRVQQKRNEKRRLNEQEQAERMERKKERDRLWRLSHPESNG